MFKLKHDIQYEDDVLAFYIDFFLAISDRRVLIARNSAIAEKPSDKFCDFNLPLSHLTPSMRGVPSTYRIHI